MSIMSNYPCSMCKLKDVCKYRRIKEDPKDWMFSGLIEPIETNVFSITINCNKFEMEEKEDV